MRLIAADYANNSSTKTARVRFISVFIQNASSTEGYISPNADGVKDTTTISATITQPSNWTLTIKNVSSTAVRTYTGAGTSLSQQWDGKDGAGLVVPDGTYTYQIDAVATGMTISASPATGTIVVDNTKPTAGIVTPAANAVVGNSVQIIGTASDTNIDTYRIDYGPTSGAGPWTNITSGTSSIINATLGTWTTNVNGSYALRLVVTDKAGNSSLANTSPIIIDTSVPTVIITSPVAGVTNLDSLPLVYSVSAGAVSVTVKLDGNVINKVSGDMLDALTNGSHTVRVEATNAANNIGFAEVTFTVAAPTGADDTNIYCMGTGTYLVSPSAFTNGISVPAANNEVRIASPLNYSTINGTKAIIKGAMDNTIPVMGVVAVVINSSGTGTYPVAVNGKYFAAQVPLAADSNTIKVIATDQNNAKHQASVTVTGVIQSNTVELSAAPSAGIPTLKPSGQTLLDVALMTSASLPTTIASYTWDFNGSGDNQLTCYSHANVNVSYEQVGLYLTTVTVTDMAGNHFTDTVIVNVVDKTAIETLLTAKWAGMKAAVLSGNTDAALNYFVPGAQDRYRAIFTNPSRNIAARLSEINRIKIYSVQDMAAEGVAIRQESDGEYAYPLTFVIDENGIWRILGF